MQIKNYTNKLFIWIFFGAFALLTLECQRKTLKQIASPQVVKKRIKHKVNTQRADFVYLTTKSKLEYSDGLDNISANATIRLKKDSVIWVSIAIPLGGEILRCLITQDTVSVLNIYQKEYYIFTYQDLKNKLNFDLNFNLIQATLLGNPPLTEIDEDSSYTKQDTSYTIIEQRRNSVKIENFVKNKTLKLEKLEIRDEATDNSLDINYDDFRPLESILFAFSNIISLKYKNNKGFQNIYIGIAHSKVEIKDKDLKFPFNIKNRFERK